MLVATLLQRDNRVGRALATLCPIPTFRFQHLKEAFELHYLQLSFRKVAQNSLDTVKKNQKILMSHG